MSPSRTRIACRTAGGGFSLIEVLISLGLLATVLISVTTLFVAGRSQVYSGRTASEATALGRSIMEEIEGWGFHQTYKQFGLDGTAATYTVSTTTNTFASKWQTVLDEKLHNASATIQMLSVDSGSPALAASRAIRVIVNVEWFEGQRRRSVELRATRI